MAIELQSRRERCVELRKVHRCVEAHSLRGIGRYFRSGQAGGHTIVRSYEVLQLPTKVPPGSKCNPPGHIGRLTAAIVKLSDPWLARLSPQSMTKSQTSRY